MLNCAGGGSLTVSHSSIHVPRSSMQKAADEYISAIGAAGIKFDLRLYLINYAAAKAGSDPKVVFDRKNKDDVTDTRIINSLVPNGADCEAYYIKDFGRDEFRKLNAGSRSGVSSSEKQGLKPTGSEKNPFREPGIRLAMSRQIWHEIGARAGWIKSAQQQPDSLQIQKNMDKNVNNQQQQAQDAQNAQQGLDALLSKQKELVGRQKKVQDQISALQRAGNGQNPQTIAPLNVEYMEIGQELEPVNEELKKYEELNKTMETARNPAMATGLKLARKEIS